jgi:hypothetical protein|tara:strand:+ start:622 stop:807 length:186 start_codon:yes stop_codon:yes gene_type:complete
MEALEVVEELVEMLVDQEIRLPLIRLKEMMVVAVSLVITQVVAVEQEELVQMVVVLLVQEE